MNIHDLDALNFLGFVLYYLGFSIMMSQILRIEEVRPFSKLEQILLIIPALASPWILITLYQLAGWIATDPLDVAVVSLVLPPIFIFSYMGSVLFAFDVKRGERK